MAETGECEPLVESLGRDVIIELPWTSDGDGNVEKNFGANAHGVLNAFKTVPGSPAPDADYDATVKDMDGIDLLSGLGANRSAVAAERVSLMGDPVQVVGKMVVNISGAGAAKKGKVYLFLRG